MLDADAFESIKMAISTEYCAEINNDLRRLEPVA